MYLYAKNEEALTIAIDFSKWFLRYTDNRTREQLDDILDFETGGMLEIWARLYDITKDSMYLTLIERYDRHRLFDPLLAGEDVLTNMNANTTIPEITGCAAVYEQLKLHVIVILCLLTGNVLLQIVVISLPAVRQMVRFGHQSIARHHALENEIKSTVVYTI